jgi:hypothetical protein
MRTSGPGFLRTYRADACWPSSDLVAGGASDWPHVNHGSQPGRRGDPLAGWGGRVAAHAVWEHRLEERIWVLAGEQEPAGRNPPSPVMAIPPGRRDHGVGLLLPPRTAAD